MITAWNGVRQKCPGNGSQTKEKTWIEQKPVTSLTRPPIAIVESVLCGYNTTHRFHAV